MNHFFHLSKRFNKPIYVSSFIISLNMAYLYRNRILSLIANTLSFFKKTPIKIQNVLTESEEYIEHKKDRFLGQYDNIDANNANMNKEFYNKDLFKEAIRDEDNDLELQWRRKLLMETTPRGNIYMYYDVYKLGFAYYTDSSTVPYSVLNAVAMKYCSIFKCLDLFVDQTVIPSDKCSPLIKIHHIEEKKTPKNDKKKLSTISKDAPFAKFKSNVNKIKSTTTEKGKETDKKEDDLTTNKFINMGKIYNMNILSNKPKKVKANFNSPMMDTLKGETQLQGQVMNYTEYKKKFNARVSQFEG